MECQGALQVLQVMSMVCPNQADSLQGSRGVNGDILAANDLGIGSGWQQSKQNWALPAVVGQQARMICNDLCWVQLAPLLPFMHFHVRGSLHRAKPNVGKLKNTEERPAGFVGFPSGIIR